MKKFLFLIIALCSVNQVVFAENSSYSLLIQPDNDNSIREVEADSFLEAQHLYDQLVQQETTYVEWNYPRYLFAEEPTELTDWHYMVNVPFSWNIAPQQQYIPTIAIVDTGINAAHQDFSETIIKTGYNFFDRTQDTKDFHGHGTAIAGIIGATIQNDFGIDGMMGPFAVRLLPIRITNEFGVADIKASIEAIDYAIAQQVDVINLSYGGSQFSMLENEAVQRAVEAGIHVVAAAGNDGRRGEHITYPASYANVLSVGATDSMYKRAAFSNYNRYVDLVAPGQAIKALANPNYTTVVNGTSFSAPIVSGALAMITSILPTSTRAEREQLLIDSLIDLGDEGKDNEYGYGFLDVSHTVTHTLQQSILNQLRQQGIIDRFSTFPLKQVSSDHTIKVNFNGDIGESIAPHLHLFYNGKQIDDYIINVEATRLTITPVDTWADGIYTIVVDEQLKSKQQQKLTSSYSATFIVNTQE